MKKYSFVLGLLALFLSCKAQDKRTASDELERFIRQKGDSLYTAEKLPGLLVGVANGSERKFYAFGYAVPDEKLPFDSSTLFEAGSITKTFTAFILQRVLRERGIADTASVLPYLPDSVRTNASLASVTFLSLLNHTSGLPRLPENMKVSEEDRLPYDHYTENDLFAYLETARPAPDGKSRYSNLGMGLAGVLAQRIMGKSYSVLLDKYVLTPFAVKPSNGAARYTKSQGYFGETKTPYWQMNVLYPAGGLVCTAGELLSYLVYMSRPHDAKNKAVIETLLQPTVALSPAVRVCKAWHTYEQKDKPVVYWHNGGTYGFSAFAAFVKETGQAVVVVANRFNANAATDGLGMAVMKKLLP